MPELKKYMWKSSKKNWLDFSYKKSYYYHTPFLKKCILHLLFQGFYRVLTIESKGMQHHQKRDFCHVSTDYFFNSESSSIVIFSTNKLKLICWLMINSSRIAFGSQKFTSSYSNLSEPWTSNVYIPKYYLAHSPNSYSLSLGFSIIFVAFKLVLNNWYLSSPESHQ